jgi:hypothetical protein
MFKWAFRLAFIAVVLVVVAFLSKDAILRSVTEHRIRKQTGMDVQIGKLSSGVFSPVVTVRDMKLYNTAEFGGTLFLDVPELHIECDPVALSRRELRIKLMRLNLKTLNLVRNEAGQTNIFSIMERVREHARGAGKDEVMGDLEFTGVDVLNLTLGKARYVDFKEPGRNREFTLNLENQIFKNVKTEADLYAVLLVVWLRSGAGMAIPPASTALPVR